MRKIFLLTILIALLFFGTTASAQETDLPDPGLTPDSPFYFLELVIERVGTFFTFGHVKKAERHTALAAERIAEAKAMVDKEKPKLAEKAVKRYEKQLEKALSRTRKAMVKGEKNVEETGKAIMEVADKHRAVLEKVLEKVPEEAKPAIQRAMTASEASKGPESFIPDSKSFKSFKAIEDFCLGMGAPPEVCGMTESRCKDLGITDPEECYTALTTVTLQAFEEAAPASVQLKESTQNGVQMQVQERTQEYTEQDGEAVQTIKTYSKVELYSIASPFSIKAREYLTENGIEFTDFNLDEDEDKKEEMFEKYGRGVVPIIIVDDVVVKGFNEAKLDGLFKN